jgi:hypothetical protein
VCRCGGISIPPKARILGPGGRGLMGAKLARTSTPGIYRSHTKECDGKGRCDCTYFVVWRHGVEGMKAPASVEIRRQEIAGITELGKLGERIENAERKLEDLRARARRAPSRVVRGHAGLAARQSRRAQPRVRRQRDRSPLRARAEEQENRPQQGGLAMFRTLTRYGSPRARSPTRSPHESLRSLRTQNVVKAGRPGCGRGGRVK